MDLETYQTSFSVEFDQALDAHIACMIEDAIPSLEVPERCYNAFCPRKGSYVILGLYRVIQESI